MLFLNVSSAVEGMPPKEDKRYLALYANSGYEIGFGKGGEYSGHSHYHFYDVLYSPNGIYLQDGSNQRGSLLVVPPRTYMPDLSLRNFFFMKWCPSPDPPVIPDKTSKVLRESSIFFHEEDSDLQFPIFPTPYSVSRALFIERLADGILINSKDLLCITVNFS